MGKRCIDVQCPYLAVDGGCLLPVLDLRNKCPAREQIIHEELDEWFYKTIEPAFRSRAVNSRTQ